LTPARGYKGISSNCWAWQDYGCGLSAQLQNKAGGIASAMGLTELYYREASRPAAPAQTSSLDAVAKSLILGAA
jgi:hypothetical protein